MFYGLQGSLVSGDDLKLIEARKEKMNKFEAVYIERDIMNQNRNIDEVVDKKSEG